jgi:hypothetical protein
VSKQIAFPKRQLAVAMAAALATGTAFSFDYTVDGLYTPPADTANPEFYGSSAGLTEFAYIHSANITSAVTDTGETANGSLPSYIDNTNGTSTSYTVTTVGVTQVTNTTSTGSVLAEANGNLTLTGGSSSSETASWDIATTFLTNNTTGLPIPNTNDTANGTWDQTNNTFAPGEQRVTSTSTGYTGGANLTMDGNAQIRNGISVVTRTNDWGYGEAGSGAGVLEVNQDYAIIGAKQQVGMSGTAAAPANGWYDPMAGINGVYATPTKTVIKGGTGTTTLTVDDDGAKFAGSTGQPVVVTGVADGSNPYDAVNMRTFDAGYSKLNRRISDVENKSYGGIAAAVALAGIPAPAAGKQYTVGAGWGNYEGENAFALGGRAQVTPEFQLTAGWGYSSEGNAFNVGAGYSW